MIDTIWTFWVILGLNYDYTDSDVSISFSNNYNFAFWIVLFTYVIIDPMDAPPIHHN